MRWSRRLLLLGPSSQSLLPIQPLSHPVVMDRLFFLPQHSFPQLPLLPPLSLCHLFKAFPGIFHHFSFPPIPLLSSSSISLSSPPSYSDSLSSLASHTFADESVSILSCTLTSSLPSSLPASYPIYRPTPIYTCSRPSSFSVGSIPYLYSSVLSTNTLSLSYHGSSSTRMPSASSGLIPNGPKKRATSSLTRDWLRSGPRDNTYYTTRRQSLRPATSGSSFPLLSSWANPASY